MLRAFIVRMKNQFGVTIKRFRLDNVGDYFNHVPTPYFHHEADVAFNEGGFYFLTPYLKGENSIDEDKDQDFYFIDPLFIDPPKVLDLVSIAVIDCIDPPKVFDPVFVPFSEPELSIEPALEN
ncbi:hypothetical protein CK203_041737 [Vitis vinifera]|uniref:Uncharacterized protein n=1 Tax=Vitis vinifera TaxID=29760 RepID=A0A438DWC0_VITVI|nr:hypothetical protein CK203_115830 [Vitis vinifera]RVW82246.1 hypothetical protein CK203_041737 [Vitis vinifera]